MGNFSDKVKERTRTRDCPKGWWRWNIKDPFRYARALAWQVEQDGRFLTASRLQEGIKEDSGSSISLDDCKAILRRIGYGKKGFGRPARRPRWWR